MSIYYGVEYRNMRTAVHGIFVYEDENTAYDVDDALQEIDDVYAPGENEFEIAPEVRPQDMMDEFADLDEIDHRDVAWDENKGEYIYDLGDGDYIIIVNVGHAVHDLYGI